MATFWIKEDYFLELEEQCSGHVNVIYMLNFAINGGDNENSCELASTEGQKILTH